MWSMIENLKLNIKIEKFYNESKPAFLFKMELTERLIE